MRTFVVATLALSLLPAAPAVDTAPPEVHSITFAKSSVTISGLRTEFVEVRVRLTDETGVQPTEYLPSDRLASPYLHLNTALDNIVLLRLAKGTPQDGIWSGSLPVTSAWSGAVTVTGIHAEDQSLTHPLEIDPRTVVDAPTLQVTSSHRPALDVTFAPEPLPSGKPFVETVRAWDTTTGKAWPGLSIRLSDDNGCVEPGAVSSVRTSANGTYRRKLTWSARQWLHCAWVSGINQPTMPEPRTMIAVDSGFVRTKRFVVRATAAATSVKAGTNVAVTGNVTPVVPGKSVRLQRLHPGNVWRTVNSVQVRTSGRYTLVATPPGRATYYYRVYAPGDGYAVGGLSKTVTIRGT
ncbi:hypothetical protein [Actinoplanes sp. NPDC020271]|uniref:hypothetical protein n=1 Tax=Actinoplanes sp. NPDC020271 TaxID=3363896 RepID=UPI003799CB5F